MKWILASTAFLAVILAPIHALAKPIVIAVIDTGVDSNNPHLCVKDHKSFTGDNRPLRDAHGHGTHIAGLIAKEAGEGDYCIVSLKFYSESNPGSINLRNTVNAINYAVDLKVNYINYSGGGEEPSEQEMLAINRAINAGIKVIAAAGNENSNLDKLCSYYPACYNKRIISVGNLEANNSGPELMKDPRYAAAAKMVGLYKEYSKPEYHRNPSSNYGKRITRWEVGTNLESTLPEGKHGKMSGTSQATAVATGKLVKERLARAK
jgi:major intracellular serine protease